MKSYAQRRGRAAAILFHFTFLEMNGSFVRPERLVQSYVALVFCYSPNEVRGASFRQRFRRCGHGPEEEESVGKEEFLLRNRRVGRGLGKREVKRSKKLHT